jgi:hypothetical protein
LFKCNALTIFTESAKAPGTRRRNVRTVRHKEVKRGVQTVPYGKKASAIDKNCNTFSTAFFQKAMQLKVKWSRGFSKRLREGIQGKKKPKKQRNARKNKTDRDLSTQQQQQQQAQSSDFGLIPQPHHPRTTPYTSPREELLQPPHPGRAPARNPQHKPTNLSDVDFHLAPQGMWN